MNKVKKVEWKKHNNKIPAEELLKLKKTLNGLENTLKDHLVDLEKIIKNIKPSDPKEK